jgi:hypothetical protein
MNEPVHESNNLATHAQSAINHLNLQPLCPSIFFFFSLVFFFFRCVRHSDDSLRPTQTSERLPQTCSNTLSFSQEAAAASAQVLSRLEQNPPALLITPAPAIIMAAAASAVVVVVAVMEVDREVQDLAVAVRQMWRAPAICTSRQFSCFNYKSVVWVAGCANAAPVIFICPPF